jgi:hypothetical protein
MLLSARTNQLQAAVRPVVVNDDGALGKLLGELHAKRERLGLPRLGKHRLALVSRQPRQCLEPLGSNMDLAGHISRFLTVQ